jgi:hypothetical protein
MIGPYPDGAEQVGKVGSGAAALPSVDGPARVCATAPRLGAGIATLRAVFLCGGEA